MSVRSGGGLMILGLWMVLTGSALAATPVCFSTAPLMLYYNGYTTLPGAGDSGAGMTLGLDSDVALSFGLARAGRADGGGVVSRRKAMGASLLIPGWGQHLAGRPVRGNVFLVAEAAIIVSFITGRVKGNINQNRYIDYAGDFAGVAEPDGRSDGYYQKLGSYISSDAYILSLRQTARAYYGDDLEAREQYIDHFRPSPEEAWLWPSDAYRENFLDLRKKSRNDYRNSDMMIGVAVVNRLLSAVDAARLVHKLNKQGAIYATMEEDVGYLGVQVIFD